MTTILQTELVDTIKPVEPQLHTLLHGTAIAPLNQFGWLRVTGEDRVRWLNGMVTNSIQDLAPGDGNFNFILSAQGRIQGTATAFAEENSILLQTDVTQIPTLIALLDRFIIMDDVELTDVSSECSGLGITGPQAAATLEAIGLHPAGLANGSMYKEALTWRDSTVVLVHAYSPLVPRYEIWAAPAVTQTVRDALLTAGALPCDPASLEQLRILEGTPRYGTDIREKELPQETAQQRALHFAKGCYLGQEIVERIRSRGSVHRTFTAFHLEGSLPAPGTPIEADGKPVGELTSVTAIQLAHGTVQVGLGYIRREAIERAQSLTCPGVIVHAITPPVRNLEAHSPTGKPSI